MWCCGKRMFPIAINVQQWQVLWNRQNKVKMKVPIEFGNGKVFGNHGECSVDRGDCCPLRTEWVASAISSRVTTVRVLWEQWCSLVGVLVGWWVLFKKYCNRAYVKSDGKELEKEGHSEESEYSKPQALCQEGGYGCWRTGTHSSPTYIGERVKGKERGKN